MSRHRMVRNLDEDDYYDDYDDEDYDDYEDVDDATQQQYAPPKTRTAIQPTTTTTAKNIAVTGKAATTATVGVTKPPPGWGKPSSSSTSSFSSSSSAPPVAAGVAKPPPGWGKPPTPPVVAAATTSFKTPPTTSGGISQPPSGWGKPTIPAAANNSSTGGVSKAPPGWGKPADSAAAAATTTTTTSNAKAATSNSSGGSKTPPPHSSSPKPSSSSSNTTTTKPLPDVLKHTQKSQLSMVVLGHVDAGKSTLMGQLLVQVGQVSKREAQKMQTQQTLSWLLDENESERQRGVTMEIATKSFPLPTHDIVILDAPGHADFIPIMITGAANADVAILVVAAVRGEFEAGFDIGKGQTREHVLLARGLGVSQVIVAINKLDVEGWSQERYREIQSKLKEYLLQQQFAPKRIRFVPLSGLTGENVKDKSDPKLLAWYKGPTLLEAIDGFQPANRQVEKPLRFIVTDIYGEGKGVVTRGRVVQGFLQVGERLVVLPIGDTANVNKLEHLQPPSDVNPKRLAIAMAGDTVELVLTGIDIMRLSVGNILANPNTVPIITKRAKAKLLVMDPLAVPIIRGAQVLFHMHSLDVPAVLTKLVAITNRDGSIKKERPRALTAGSSAVVELTLSDKIVLEPFSQCRALGRFVLRRGGDTIAVGVIDELL